MTSSRSTEDPDGPAADFLTRWSRRKTAARQAQSEPVPATMAEEPGAEVFEEAPPPELPDIDTLESGSDFRPFLQPQVPAGLRRDALRRLWRVNPVINSLDGLDDYYVTQDFTDGATVVADLKTLYRVGQGMLERLEALAEEPAPEDSTAQPTLVEGPDGSEPPVGIDAPAGSLPIG